MEEPMQKFEIENATTELPNPDRRTVIAAIGAAAAATGISAASSGAQAAPSAPRPEILWDRRYEALKGSVRLQLYRRRLKAPVAGEAPLPVLIVEKETGARKYHMVGESSGALRCAAFAAEYPDRVDRLVFSAYTYTGKDSPTLADRAKGLEFYRTHNRRPRPKEMLESIFTRDKPGTSDPRTAAALVAAELPFGDSVPTGTYLDMTSKLPIIEARLIKAPVLVARGQYDGIATEADLLDFYHQLPNPDRQFVTLPGLAHSLVLGANRELFWHATHSFLSMPKPLVTV